MSYQTFTARDKCACGCGTPITQRPMGARRLYYGSHRLTGARRRYGLNRAANANTGHSGAMTPAQVTKAILNGLGRDAWTDKRESPRQSYGFTRSGIYATLGGI
jgi:hypothetical protein